MHTFEFDGVLFEVESLGVDASCEGLELVGKAVEHVVRAGEELNWVAALIQQARLFPQLLKLFAPVTKVSRQKDGRFAVGGDMVSLKPFVEDCFKGNQKRLLGFLVRACRQEYTSFFVGASELDSLLADVKPNA